MKKLLLTIAFSLCYWSALPQLSVNCIVPWFHGTPAGGLVGNPAFVSFLHQASPRNNFSGRVGLEMTPSGPGSMTFTITAVGVWVITGDSNTMTISIYKNSTLVATGGVNTSLGTANSFLYQAITPVVVTVNGTSDKIYCEVTETSGQDPWLDGCTSNQYSIDSFFNCGGVAAINETVSICASGFHGYVIPNFLFTH